jgi:SAM-dependent methyltransferase
VLVRPPAALSAREPTAIVRVASGRRAGQRFDAVHGVTTEGLVFLGDLDPEAVGPGIAFATHYEPTPVGHAERLLDAIPLAPEQTTLIDLGAGMGRVVLLAAQRGYRRVVGVEISPALVEIARENIAAFAGPLNAKRIRVVRADATSFRLPRGNLALYLYNPFRFEVLSAVLEQLVARPAGDAIAIAYHTPVERAAIDATGAFDIVADIGFGVVYQLSRRPSNPSNPGSRGRC